MKKIAIFQSNLNVGGIQKSLINLLNNIPKEKYEIDLYLFSNVNFFDENIPSNINKILLKKPSFCCKFIPFSLFKKIYNININNKKYDISIDFDSYQHVTALGAIAANSKKKVMWIHNDVQKKLKEEKKYRILHFFFKGKYKYFDKFIGVSKGVIKPFKEITKMYDKEYDVIANLIPTENLIEKSNEDIDIKIDKKKYNVCTVGRLCHQKGIDILLNEISKVIIIRKNIHFYIIGDGPDKNNLLSQTKLLLLDKYVTFLGNQSNPFKYMKKMDAFVLTSRYEGQGMVLWEAHALGLKLIFSKHLEIYNEGLIGTENIVNELINSKKNVKKINKLEKYNSNIINKICNLFNGS